MVCDTSESSRWLSLPPRTFCIMELVMGSLSELMRGSVSSPYVKGLAEIPAGWMLRKSQQAHQCLGQRACIHRPHCKPFHSSNCTHSLICTHTCACIHKYPHTHTFACTYTNTHVCICTHTSSLKHTHTYALICTHTHACMHTVAHIHIQMHTHACTHTCSLEHTCTHSCMNAHSCSHMHTNAHSSMHVHITHALACTHVHTLMTFLASNGKSSAEYKDMGWIQKAGADIAQNPQGTQCWA